MAASQGDNPLNRMIACACAAAILAATPVWADEASIAHGKEIVTEACAACHQVAAEQLLPPPVNDPNEQTMVAGPSFYDIAHAHGADADYLRNKILLPQHPMKAQDWNEANLKAVIDYIQSLPRE